jgi:hypothetical protein
MTPTLPNSVLESEGKTSASDFQPELALESAGKRAAVIALEAAIRESGLDRKALVDESGWSEGQFSKVANGAQGCLVDLAYRLPKKLRADFFRRLDELENIDPRVLAAERLMTAALQFIRTCSMPHRTSQMAPADLKRRAIS